MLSTKNVSTGKTAKTMSVGNHKARIYDLRLIDGYNKGSYYVELSLEGEPQGEDFQGFAYDNNDLSKGYAKGQVARVKSGRYAYEDKELPTGTVISRDQSILRFFMAIAKEQGTSDMLDTIEADTIEDWVEKAKAVVCNDTYLYFCLGGKPYEKNGYTNYYLHLPKAEGTKVAISATEDKVIKFNESEHLLEDKKASTQVDNFDIPPTENPDFKF